MTGKSDFTRVGRRALGVSMLGIEFGAVLVPASGFVFMLRDGGRKCHLLVSLPLEGVCL